MSINYNSTGKYQSLYSPSSTTSTFPPSNRNTLSVTGSSTAFTQSSYPKSIKLSQLLTQELDNIESLWKMYNRARESLPYQARMENLTWRMMYINNKSIFTNNNSAIPGIHHDDTNIVEEILDPTGDEFDYVAHIRKIGQNNTMNDAHMINDDDDDNDDDDITASTGGMTSISTRKRPAPFSPLIQPENRQFHYYLPNFINNKPTTILFINNSNIMEMIRIILIMVVFNQCNMKLLNRFLRHLNFL